MLLLTYLNFAPDFSDPTTLILLAWFLFSLGTVTAIYIWRKGSPRE